MSFTRRLTPEDIRRIDTSNMAGHIADMGSHIREAVQLANTVLEAWQAPKDIRSIVIAGIGGSGIGGAFVRSYLSSLTVPIAVTRSYSLPSWANEHSLVIASSYSGNTEETLSAFE